ncbi:MAG: META domain-containing protein, partial [Betaproteobacteria bacterium]
MTRRLPWLAPILWIAVAWLAGCASGGRPAADGVMLVRGELASRARIALPADGVAIVELTRPQDGRVIAEQRIELNGRQVPIAFELRVQRAALRDDTGYALRGAVHSRGQARWLSDPVDVRVARGDVNAGALMLRPWEAVAFASRLDCGPRTARVGIVRSGDRDVTRLTVDGERYALNSVVSASGSRYEAAGDPSTQLWVKGDRATLTLRGERLPECTVVRDAPDAVRARGNEPSWGLELGTALVFVTPDLRIEGTAPPAQFVNGERRHAGIVNGRSVNVALAPRVCRDTMSGMPHPFTAEVVVSGRTFRGCGGEPETLLTGGEWVADAIGGTLVDRSRATLEFSVDGRLAGRASCNAYTTSYRLTGESLTIGAAATTMMSCAPSLMEQEQRFLD